MICQYLPVTSRSTEKESHFVCIHRSRSLELFAFAVCARHNLYINIYIHIVSVLYFEHFTKHCHDIILMFASKHNSNSLPTIYFVEMAICVQYLYSWQEWKDISFIYLLTFMQTNKISRYIRKQIYIYAY